MVDSKDFNTYPSDDPPLPQAGETEATRHERKRIMGLPRGSLTNLPNMLTSLRLVLAFVLFALIDQQWWLTGALVFAAAAITDWLDGYFARLQGLVSSLGRVYDPLVDKILVCGTFVFFLAHPSAGLNPWMVSVIIVREFLVTGLRGFLEDRGVSFGADYLGKIKMVLQCAAILINLLTLAWVPLYPSLAWMTPVRDGLNWATVIVTFLSGANYVRKALTHLT